VKAGSWGARTVEKIVRLTEYALRHETPVFWLVDSAGARITDQVELFPGRRGAGRIFYNQIKLSGRVPQVCCLFGPSAAGGAYIPLDRHALVDGIIDAESFFEIKPLYAPEVIVGFGRIDGAPVGIVANNPAQLGGVLFVDSADKCTRFINLCDAFNVPLVFLA